MMTDVSALPALWRDVTSAGYELPTVEFYSHSKGTYASFSNFFEHEPFTFAVPECCGRAELPTSR